MKQNASDFGLQAKALLIGITWMLSLTLVALLIGWTDVQAFAGGCWIGGYASGHWLGRKRGQVDGTTPTQQEA